MNTLPSHQTLICPFRQYINILVWKNYFHDADEMVIFFLITLLLLNSTLKGALSRFLPVLLTCTSEHSGVLTSSGGLCYDLRGCAGAAITRCTDAMAKQIFFSQL